MLAELALYLATPVPRAVRRHGLLRESVGLWSRGFRHRKVWAEHAHRCKAVVSQSLAGLTRYRTVVVLGSGLVRDVPMDVLVQRFEKVVLVDAVHLWPVRLRWFAERKVHVVTRDLTGLLDQMGGDRQMRRAAPLADLQADARIDLVISANVLSQLPLPVERALDAGMIRDAGLPRAVLDAHLADLSGFSARICLLTDESYSAINGAGVEIERVDLLHGVQLPDGGEQWDWPVSPMGEEDKRAAFIHHVRGYPDWKPVFVANVGS